MTYLEVIGKKSQEFIIAVNNVGIVILNSNNSRNALNKSVNQFNLFNVTRGFNYQFNEYRIKCFSN